MGKASHEARVASRPIYAFPNLSLNFTCSLNFDFDFSSSSNSNPTQPNLSPQA